jgi:hypothetical protein
MRFRLTAPPSNVPDPPVPNPKLWEMPIVPPPPAMPAPPLQETWFDMLTRWAEREERGVLGASGRLLLACSAVLALLFVLAR